MSTTTTDPGLLPEPSGSPRALAASVVIALVVATALAVLFGEALAWMYLDWESPEYNHGYMIPFVAVYLLWLQARELSAVRFAGSWFGIFLILLSLAVLLLGERSSVYALMQYAFIMVFWALAFAGGGVRAIRLLWVPLLYLAFMVPLPDFIAQKLTAGLQLVSSQIGVAVIRAAGISVFLEGNVIDLGNYKLQVVEACSGMRYLFPLLSFGFLCAVLFRGRLWQRVFLLVSTVPITILMNSFRIGVIGVLVNFYGIEQAEGFLHDFEGWVIFMACVGVLFAEIWIFARMEGRRFLEIFGLDLPPAGDLVALVGSLRPNRKLVGAVAVLAVAALLNQLLPRPPTLIPQRTPLGTFPMILGDFTGRDELLDPVYQNALLVSDYVIGRYQRAPDEPPVDLWVAYYDSQVKGASVHSPQSCLPGGGWRIRSFSQQAIPGVLADGGGLTVNRVEISMGDQSQLVYYWFPQRGRIITSEYLVKWFIFWDGLRTNRTDGALVRLMTYVGDDANMPEAEARLQAFVRAADPKLAFYLPGASAATRVATAEETASLRERAKTTRNPGSEPD